MSYKAYVCQITNLKNHPKGDKLFIGECFGNPVIVSRDKYYNEMIGVYFPEGGQLSEQFAEYNNLLRKKDENGNNIGGYMDPNKRNVTAIRLRGEKSDGLFLPLSCLDYCFKDGAEAHLKLGDTIDIVNGYHICEKYIPKVKESHSSIGNKTRKRKVPIAPLFAEHADTSQLAYNLDDFKPGDEIEITLKMHGTSQRTGYLPILQNTSFEWNSYIMAKLHTLIPRKKWRISFGQKFGKPVYKYGYVSGTRRTVLESYDGGFYGSDLFRKKHADFFEGKLWKGETAYYEVVGFMDKGAPIMADCSNKKLNDKDFIKQYGPTTVFSYGCAPNSSFIPRNDIYVYRMTMTNEDGNVIEYTPDFMRYRCEQMGVKTVPVFAKGVINYDGSVHYHNMITEEEMTTLRGEELEPGNPLSFAIIPGESVKELAEAFYDGPDPIGKTHIREGVVVRIINRPKFCAYKHKNHTFKMISGIITEQVADDKDNAMSEDILSEL